MSNSAGKCLPPALLDVDGVADYLGCSTRHVLRMVDAGNMPKPVKLGRIVRWSRVAIEDWIADGCPRCGEEDGHARS